MEEEKDIPAEDTVAAENKYICIPYPILILLVLGVIGQQEYIPLVLGL
jgi:hypothetical protein